MSASEPPASSTRMLEILRDVIIETVRKDGPDLTMRQLSILLVCYLEPGPHTVRGFAERLGISRPSITGSLDRLEHLKLLRRLPDPADRRSILMGRTRAGTSYLVAIRRSAAEAARNGYPV